VQHHRQWSVSEDFQQDVAPGGDILKSGRCHEVCLLSSVAEGRAGAASDVDFAVRGCPPEQIFKLQGRLLMALEHSADLIDLDIAPDLAAFLARESVLVCVG